VLEGRLSVSTDAGTLTAGPGEIVYMPKGESVTITAHEQGALTAYVTYRTGRTHAAEPGNSPHSHSIVPVVWR
jgi:ethanolamine utilization protein EutQ (cupin superfamily)